MKYEALKNHIPQDGLPFIEEWLKGHSLILKIKSARKTKLGDYTFLPAQNRHQITMDVTLSKEAFFFVLTHEIAHLHVFNLYRNRVLPHGKEWKLIFGKFLRQSLKVYPEELRKAIFAHSLQPKASVGADRSLHKKLFIPEVNLHKLVENLTLGQKFILGNRVFEKGEKRKTRYLCKELSGQKFYLVSGHAIVDKII